MKEKMRKFWEEHKEQIVLGGVAVGGFLLGVLYENFRDSSCDISLNRDSSEYEIPGEIPSSKNGRLIDEDIFTNIAPQIEAVILEEGLDEAYIDATYDVEYPKGGDYKNGTYTVKKKLDIYVRDMCDREE